MDLFARLKNETAPAHQALEDQLDLLSPRLTRVRYIELLQGFLGYVEPYEAALCEHCPGDQRDLLAGRLRADRLRADLQALGVGPATLATLPQHPPLRDMRRQAAWFGRFYVMEGSTLGARIIGPHLSRHLAFSEGRGNAYFLGHGARSGAMWQAFRARMTAALAPAEHDAAVAAAHAGFDDLRRWFAHAQRSAA